MDDTNLSYFISKNNIYRSYNARLIPYEYKWIIADSVKNRGKFVKVCTDDEHCCACKNDAKVMLQLFQEKILLCADCANNKISPSSIADTADIFENNNYCTDELFTKYFKIKILYDKEIFFLTEKMCAVGEIVWFFAREYGGCNVCLNGRSGGLFHCGCRIAAARYVVNLLTQYYLLAPILVDNVDIAGKIMDIYLQILNFGGHLSWLIEVAQ